MKRNLALTLAITTASCLLVHSLYAATNAVKAVPGFGVVIDPDGDCAFQTNGGALVITVPGSVHDLSGVYDKKNAPRVLQEVKGDFTIQVKVTGEFDPGDGSVIEGRVAFNSAGLLLWDGDANYIRLERAIMVLPNGDRYGYAPLFEYWRKNEHVPPNIGREEPLIESEFSYLRMTRHGRKVDVAVSEDGHKWYKAGAITARLSRTLKIGVMAINTSKKPFRVEFSDLKLAKGSPR